MSNLWEFRSCFFRLQDPCLSFNAGCIPMEASTWHFPTATSAIQASNKQSYFGQCEFQGANDNAFLNNSLSTHQPMLQESQSLGNAECQLLGQMPNQQLLSHQAIELPPHTVPTSRSFPANSFPLSKVNDRPLQCPECAAGKPVSFYISWTTWDTSFKIVCNISLSRIVFTIQDLHTYYSITP